MFLKSAIPGHLLRCRVSGFTLMELLVVIGVIAILAALVFTGASKASKQADTAKEISNLRQTGAAVLAFSGENNGQTPTSGARIRYGQIDGDTGLGPWTEQIEDYVKGDRKIFSLSDEVDTTTGEYTVDFFLGTRAGYVEAQEEDNDSSFQPVRLARLASTSRYVLVGKNAAITFPVDDADPDNYTQEPAFGSSGTGSEPVPIFFADGHVNSPKEYDTQLLTTTYHGTETSFQD